MKKFVLAMLAVMALLLVPAMAASSNYDITGVYVEDMELQPAQGNAVYTERGETLEITVFLQGTGNTKDVNIKAWLGGYEYDNVQVTSEMFDVEQGLQYRHKLYLTLPTDLNAEQEYTLYVEVYDDLESESWSADAQIHVSKVRNLLAFQDVLVENSVDAGDFTSVTVRLEDMGDHKEEDIKVTVSNDALGILTSTYLDELTNTEIDNEDEESSGDVTLTFQIPADAETGAYNLDVVVTYDRGHEEIRTSASLNVEGQAEDNVVVVVGTDNGSDSEEDFSTALRLGFGILAVLIVILALILIVRR